MADQAWSNIIKENPIDASLYIFLAAFKNVCKRAKIEPSVDAVEQLSVEGQLYWGHLSCSADVVGASQISNSSSSSCSQRYRALQLLSYSVRGAEGFSRANWRGSSRPSPPTRSTSTGRSLF